MQWVHGDFSLLDFCAIKLHSHSCDCESKASSPIRPFFELTGAHSHGYCQQSCCRDFKILRGQHDRHESPIGPYSVVACLDWQQMCRGPGVRASAGKGPVGGPRIVLGPLAPWLPCGTAGALALTAEFEAWWRVSCLPSFHALSDITNIPKPGVTSGGPVGLRGIAAGTQACRADGAPTVSMGRGNWATRSRAVWLSVQLQCLAGSAVVAHATGQLPSADMACVRLPHVVLLCRF